MLFDYAYHGDTTVDNSAVQTKLSFSPDIKRPPTFFRGELRKGVMFREAISALHEVVISDLRFQPRDKSAYKAWAAQREQEEWGLLQAHLADQKKEVLTQIETLQDELKMFQARYAKRMAPFYKARQKYFNFLYQEDHDAWFVLDPVITVHPDEIFFECFSQDESSYGRLSVDYEVFKNIGEFSCGVTNIDYSQGLYDEFQKIRSYKTTSFDIDPSGFEVQTSGEDYYKEVKIDLPDSWVRGFLQVSSAMHLPAVRFELHPLDVHNFCFVLRRRKEKQGPRSMRYRLTPGEPVRVIFEPWNIEVACPRSVYTGETSEEIRVWGRRRLHILERLIPVSKKFTVHLLGSGMPSFYVADMGDMWFTLGLSGWTANDWSTAGQFDLLAPRAQVDELTQRQVLTALQSCWRDTPTALAERLRLERSQVLGALGLLTQAGRSVFDLNKQVYRLRELSRNPLPLQQLRYANPREESARRFLEQGDVVIKQCEHHEGSWLKLSGQVRDKRKKYAPSLTLDNDHRIIHAACNCNWHQQNKLYKGPCEHILALRLYYNRRDVHNIN